MNSWPTIDENNCSIIFEPLVYNADRFADTMHRVQCIFTITYFHELVASFREFLANKVSCMLKVHNQHH